MGSRPPHSRNVSFLPLHLGTNRKLQSEHPSSAQSPVGAESTCPLRAPLSAFPHVGPRVSGVSGPRTPEPGATALTGQHLPARSLLHQARIPGFSWGTRATLASPCQPPASHCRTLIYWPNIPGITFCSVFCFLEQPLEASSFCFECGGLLLSSPPDTSSRAGTMPRVDGLEGLRAQGPAALRARSWSPQMPGLPRGPAAHQHLPLHAAPGAGFRDLAWPSRGASSPPGLIAFFLFPGSLLLKMLLQGALSPSP